MNPQQLRLAADIIEKGLDYQWRMHPHGGWSSPFPSCSDLEDNMKICLRNGWEIRLAPVQQRVPLGPGDVPPGSVVRYKLWTSDEWELVQRVESTGIARHGELFTEWRELAEDFEILRPAGQWESCSKEA